MQALGFDYELTIQILQVLFVLAPIWVPLILFLAFWRLWMTYIRSLSIYEAGFLLLEIKIPQEITKSPAAMEIFISQLHQTGGNTYIDTFWGGKVRPWFSFELASFGGEVHFFIWTQTKWKDYIEAQLYAQYPNIEIYEVPDYTKKVEHDLDKRMMWITYFTLSEADPFPIKTYVDYGMDKDPKEEFKIDPMTSVLEYLGSLRPGEQAWIQIMIQAHKKESWKDGRLFTIPDWKDGAKKIIQKIRSESTQKHKDQEGVEREGFPNPTPGQIEQIKAIERSINKFPFDVGIRAAYIAENDAFNPIHINGLIGSFRQYSSQNLNGFKLGPFTDFDYPWQDFRRMRRTALEKSYLEAFKRRSFFNPPFRFYRQKPFILTSEELATIFHMPGQVVQTPTFGRIASKKAEPPANLPR